MAEKFDQRGKSKNPNKLRNLSQYKGMTDEEFSLRMSEKEQAVGTSKRLEERIDEKLAKFSDDYDLSDMKINDREILRALIQAIISLEDYEQYLFQTREGGINPDNLLVIDKIQKTMSDLRKDISNFQNDLNITRKHRKSDQETSVVAYIDSLKEKARKFYQSKMNYVICPKCNTVLGTTWFLYPEGNNQMSFTCLQKDANGNACNTKVKVSSKELIENRGTNKKDVVPDSLL